MNIIDIRQYCLDKMGATESAPFDPDVPVYKVLDKMFALIDTGIAKGITLKCDPERIIELRDKYEGINGAPHFNKKYWIRIELDQVTNSKLIRELIDHSYDEVLKKVSKKKVAELKDKYMYVLQYFKLSGIDSTHDCNFARLEASASNAIPVVYTDYQKAGRGSDKNKWESEAGKNILCSFQLFPRFMDVRVQFYLSMIASLAIKDELSRYADGFTVKWPNDVYWNDKKIAGILISCYPSGKILNETVVSFGINVNQTVFTSNAPNPVSLCQITGNTHDTTALMKNIVERCIEYYKDLKKGKNKAIYQAYRDSMYRKDGFHTFKDWRGEFKARIFNVKENGEICLEFEDGEVIIYQYHRVEFVI